MRTVGIRIFNIGRTSLDRDEVQRWLRDLEVSEEAIQRLLDKDVTDCANLVRLLGKRCYDDQTEVLTDAGWKLFVDLDETERVMTLNLKSGEMEWQKPHGYLAEDFDGDLISAEGRDVSVAVTPDHRVVQPLDDGGYRIDTAESIEKNSKVRFPTTAKSWRGRIPHIILDEIEAEQEIANGFGSYGSATRTVSKCRVLRGEHVISMAKLIAYFITEGTESDAPASNASIFVYGDHVEQIREICTDLGLKSSVTIDKRNNCPRTRIGGGRQMFNYLRAQCGHGSSEKHFPRWVLDLPVAALQTIWNIMVGTDGHRRKDADGREVVNTTSIVLAGQLQEILAKIGCWGALHYVDPKPRPSNHIQSRKRYYTVARRSRNFVEVNGTGKARFERKAYSGKIYCVSTENGVILVRRKHSIYFSGNCYMAFEGEGKTNPNVQRVRENIVEYIDNILESKHGSVIEHVNYTFAIEGISRVLTAELNRHRAGVAISEGSMRFIRFKDLPYWLPASIREDPADTSDVAQKKDSSREIFERAFRQAEENYAALESLWASDLDPKSKFKQKKQVTSMMRRVVPIGVSTGGGWTFNFRSLRHVCTMRADESAEEEINELAVGLLRRMMTAEIHFFSDFSQNEKGFWRPKHWKV